MNNYAMVVDDTHMTEGVHALLNALCYYGAADDIDFHYLFWPGSTAEQALNAGTYSWYPNFYPRCLEPALFAPEYTPVFADCANAMYHMRWAFCDQLREYEAVSLWDADLLCLDDPRKWFRVAAQTNMFLAPANDFSGYELETGRANLAGIEGDASPPIHNQPCWFSPRKWGRFMADIPLKGLREHRSDITTLSRKLIEEDLTDEVLVLPNALFLATHYYRQRYVKRQIGDRIHIALHENGDRVQAIHRRWWMPSICTQFLTDITPGEDRERGRNNIRLFHDMYTFFNRDCTHRLEYDYEWQEPPE